MSSSLGRNLQCLKLSFDIMGQDSQQSMSVCSSQERNLTKQLPICMPECQRQFRSSFLVSQRGGVSHSTNKFPRKLSRNCTSLWFYACNEKRLMPPSYAVGLDLRVHNMFEERADRCHLSAPVKRPKRKFSSSTSQV